MATSVLNPKRDPVKVLDELLFTDIPFKAAEWVLKRPKIEQGGFIQWNSHKDEYLWLPTPNAFEDTPDARVLFEPPEEYHEKIFSMAEGGVFLVATFHSHPHGSTRPSSQDINVLFQNAPLHLIFAQPRPHVKIVTAYTSTAEELKTFYLGE